MHRGIDPSTRREASTCFMLCPPEGWRAGWLLRVRSQFTSRQQTTQRKCCGRPSSSVGYILLTHHSLYANPQHRKRAMLQTLARRGGSALLRRRRLPAATLPSLPSAAPAASAAEAGSRSLSTAAAAAAAAAKQPPPSAASPQPPANGGRDAPKKRKGKKPSATQAYLAERAAALARHEEAAKAAQLPWRTVAAWCVVACLCRLWLKGFACYVTWASV